MSSPHQRLEDIRTQYAGAIRARDAFKEKVRKLKQRLEAAKRDEKPDYWRLRQRWIVKIQAPMLLISQVQRGGGTLLNRLFDGHPECVTHPMELRWGRPKKWDWPSFTPTPDLSARDAFALLDERWISKLIQDGGYNKYAQWTLTSQPEEARLYPFVFDRELQFDLFAREYASAASGTRRDVLNAWLTALFNAWLDYQNLYASPKRWVTSFIPRVVSHPDSLQRFFDDYPDGFLVTLVRHPVSWFASASRHTFPDAPEVAIKFWRESTRGSLAAAETYGDRVMVVLFEDLVTRTEAVMRAICARIGLTFDPVLLRPTYNGMPVLSDSSFHLTTEIDPSAARRLGEGLTPDQIEKVERLALDDYERVVARFALPPDAVATGEGQAAAASVDSRPRRPG